MSAKRSKANQERFQLIWWRSQGCRCRCGKLPEKNKSLLRSNYSLSCKCGGKKINFLVRSNSPQKVRENWESLIRKTPYKSQVHKTHHMKENAFPLFNSVDRHHGNRLAQLIESQGGHCAGSHGGCS